MNKEHFTIGELSEITGVSRRAIRFYVQRGLLPPPAGAGRGHYYTAAHRERLDAIRARQEVGLSLDEIRLALDTQPGDSPPPAPPPPSPGLWLRLEAAPGVELNIEAGRYRLSPARLRRIVEALRPHFQEALEPEHEQEEKHGSETEEDQES